MIQLERSTASPRFRELSPIEQRILVELARGGEQAEVIEKVGIDACLYQPTVDGLFEQLSISRVRHVLMWMLAQPDASASLYGPHAPLGPSVRLQKIHLKLSCAVVEVDTWSMLPNAFSTEGTQPVHVPALAS